MFCYLLMLVAVPGMVNAGSIPSAGHVRFVQPGNVTLGAMFPMQQWTSGPPCSGKAHPWGSEVVALIMYTVETINRRRDLLPDVTIGFDIRNDCYSEPMSFWSALALASTAEQPQEDVEFKKISPSDTGKLLCIIGTESSSTSIMTAFAAGLYRIPVISPFATSNELSVKSRFPYFLRTVPPDNLQATAMVDILLRFGWKYIGLYFELSSYGIHGAQAVLDLAEEHGICVAFSVPVRPEAPKVEVDELVLNLVNFPKANVVIMFVSTESAGAVLRSVDEMANLRNITFISSDGWKDKRGLILQGVNLKLLEGSVFLNVDSGKIPGFPEYYRSLQLQEEPFSPWFQDLKERWFASQDCLNLADCPGLQTFNSDNTLADAISAFAYALQDMINDKCTSDIDCNALLQNITGYELHPYLLNVKFEGIGGKHYSFDEKGNPGGKYDISVFKKVDGEYLFFPVGNWIGSSANPLQIDTTDVVWPGGSPDPVVSLCRDICQAGFVEVPLEQKCCSGCQKCPDDAIVKDSSCEACPEYEWPDTNFLKCTPIVPTPPDWGEPIVIVIVILSACGLILSGLASVGLFYYRQNVLIKAASRELSSINIFGLSLAFLSPFLLLVPPTDVSCRALDIVISVCFGLTYAPTLLKVNRIYRIFDAGKKSNKCPRFIGSGAQMIIVGSIVSVTVVISIVGIFVDPTKPAKLRFFPPTNYIEAYCQFGYGFLASIVYNLLLILACCYYAFKARRVPSNYNESKFIALSVYSTLVFGMAAVPVYITAQYTLQKVATFCVAILLNSFLTLFCVYLPKLYAILLAKDVELCEWRANTASTDVVTTTSAASRHGTAQVQPAPEDVKQVTDQVKET